MKVRYKVKEIYPKLYCVEFKNAYDMCMTFFRVSEYYESNSNKIRGNANLDVFEAMKEYAKANKDSFSYPTDYVGFNIPGHVFHYELDLLTGVNPYDLIMSEMVDKIYDLLDKKYNNSFLPFYIIGICNKAEAKRTLKHEISHGLYYLNPSYKKEMDKLVSELPPIKKKMMQDVLRRLHKYPDKVIRDEMIAYLSTGLIYGMKQIRFSKKTLKSFQKVFKDFFNEQTK